ncbi:hypothetical protein Tco_1276235 [Tanacetum coccineum]
MKFSTNHPQSRNENDKGDVEFIEEDKYTQGIMKENVFEKDVLSNDVGDMELKSIDGIGIGRMTNKEIKKDDKGMLKEPKKEWKLNEKVQVMEEDA